MWQEVEENPSEMEEVETSGYSGDASSAFSELSASGYSGTLSAYSDTAPSTYTYTEPAVSPTVTVTTTAATSSQSEPVSDQTSYMDTESAVLLSIPEEEETQATSAEQPLPKVEKKKAASDRVAVFARVLGILFIAAIGIVVVIEFVGWYKFYDHPVAKGKGWGPGWTSWLRHPLAPFKDRLDDVAARRNPTEIREVKTQLRYIYMLLGDGLGAKSRQELLYQYGSLWTKEIIATLNNTLKRAKLEQERGKKWVGEVNLQFGPGSRGIKRKRERMARMEAEPRVKRLEEMTGPMADGLDWWLAAGGAGLAGLCSVLAFVGHGQKRSLHCLGCSIGGIASLSLGILYTVWLVEAARDVFGTDYMLCPLLYASFFLALSIAFTADAFLAFPKS